MSKQCLGKNEDGSQCPVELEMGLFCQKHSKASKPEPRRSGGGGGPGPGWGLGGRSGNSMLRYYGVVYHHRPPDEKD